MEETAQVIVGNVLSIIGLGFFIRMWINGVNERLKELNRDLQTKVETSHCNERRADLRRDIERIEKG